MRSTAPGPAAAMYVRHFDSPVMSITMRLESRSAARFRLRRASGAVGDLMPTQPGAAASSGALLKFGESGNKDAVWPSSPMPRTTTSKGRGELSRQGVQVRVADGRRLRIHDGSLFIVP